MAETFSVFFPGDRFITQDVNGNLKIWKVSKDGTPIQIDRGGSGSDDGLQL